MSRRSARVAVGVGGSRKSSVEVLLAKDVPHLGHSGEIVRVKPGYARNYLLPQGLATIATDANKRQIARYQQKLEEYRIQRVRDLKSLADRINKYSVTIEAHANEEGHLYGSVTANDIAKALRDADYPVEAEMIRLEGALKITGMYEVDLILEKGVETTVKVWVVPTAAGKTPTASK